MGGVMASKGNDCKLKKLIKTKLTYVAYSALLGVASPFSYFHVADFQRRRICKSTQLPDINNLAKSYASKMGYSQKYQQQKLDKRMKRNDIDVHVWDHVFSQKNCHILHELAWDHNERAESSTFTRPKPKLLDHDSERYTKLTVLEQAIDSVLTAIEENEQVGIDRDGHTKNTKGDDDMVVEYWSRQHHANIDLHCDIDEEQFLDDESIRTPKHGHVLYLKIGKNIQQNRMAPTVIFPNKNKKWATGTATGTQEKEEDVDIVSVPAFEGRLLRFDGSMLHAVPCPVLKWFQDHPELTDTDVEDFENDDESIPFIEDEDLRSVLIFNTWPSSSGPPPRGVDPDPLSGELPIGIEIDSNDCIDDSFDGPEEVIRCERYQHWERKKINSESNLLQSRQSHKTRIGNIRQGKLPLLGNKVRRGCESKYLDFIAPQSLDLVLMNTREVFKTNITTFFTK